MYMVNILPKTTQYQIEINIKLLEIKNLQTFFFNENCEKVFLEFILTKNTFQNIYFCFVKQKRRFTSFSAALNLLPVHTLQGLEVDNFHFYNAIIRQTFFK